MSAYQRILLSWVNTRIPSYLEGFVLAAFRCVRLCPDFLLYVTWLEVVFHFLDVIFKDLKGEADDWFDIYSLFGIVSLPCNLPNASKILAGFSIMVT